MDELNEYLESTCVRCDDGIYQCANEKKYILKKPLYMMNLIAINVLTT